MMRSCSEVERFVDLYLDAEFGDEDRGKFEAHLEGCSPCRHMVENQATWRRQIVAASASKASCPAALRNRIAAGLDEAERADRSSSLRRRAFAMVAVPAAAAAAYAIVIQRPTTVPVQSVAMELPMVADVVQKHSRNLPIEVQSPKEDDLRRWYADKVSFPVRPPKFRNVSAMLRGGRLANVRERDAAYLVYDVNGNKVSVFMFDPREMQPSQLPRQQLGGHDVTLTQERGYNVALFEDAGVGYAIASDMDRDSMVKLISAVGH